ncbi:MAG: molybdenum cofactor guanylyltransferase [Solirubrobacterales bacterium]
MRRANALGAVLAGGLGTRMGEPKAGLELAGRTLVGRVVAAVGAAGLEPIVVAKPDSPLPRLDCRVLAEPSEPRHPLCGVVAALSASAGRGIVALACDMPLVPAKLIAWLAAIDHEAAVCEVDGRVQPLLARYRPSVTARLAEALERRDSMRDAVAALHPRIVGEPELRRFGDPERIAFNVNEPADLAHAATLLAGGRGRFRQVLERPRSASR